MSFFVKDWQMRYPKWRRVRDDHSAQGKSVIFSLDGEIKNHQQQVGDGESPAEVSIEFWEGNLPITGTKKKFKK